MTTDSSLIFLSLLIFLTIKSLVTDVSNFFLLRRISSKISLIETSVRSLSLRSEENAGVDLEKRLESLQRMRFSPMNMNNVTFLKKK